MKEKYDELIKSFTEHTGNIITLLQETQSTFGYVPEDAVFYFSQELEIPASSIFGVATFYAQFSLKPRGRNIITACCGTACHVKGSDRIISNLKRELDLSEGENTTADLNFTLEEVACVGACSAAPVAIINENVYGHISFESLKREINKIKEQPK